MTDKQALVSRSELRAALALACKITERRNILPILSNVALLIAAAPDLLAALRFAVARVEIANGEGDPILSAWLPDARAAIAKAEGRPE